MNGADLTPVAVETAALLRLAAAAQHAERYGEATRLYAEALERSPDHRAARFNHAVSCLRTVHEGRNDANGALASLERLCTLIDEDSDASAPWTPLRCSVIYNRALANWYVALRDDPLSHRSKWISAVTDARGLRAHLSARETPSRIARRAPRDPFWGRLDAASATLLAAVVVAADAAGVFPEGRPHDLDDSREAIGRWADTDDSRTAYNLALCHVAGAQGEPSEVDHEPLDLALGALEIALRDATLVAWAYQDPLLAPLREARRPQFERLVRRRLIQSGRAFPPVTEKQAPAEASRRYTDDFGGALPE